MTDTPQEAPAAPAPGSTLQAPYKSAGNGVKVRLPAKAFAGGEELIKCNMTDGQMQIIIRKRRDGYTKREANKLLKQPHPVFLELVGSDRIQTFVEDAAFVEETLKPKQDWDRELLGEFTAAVNEGVIKTPEQAKNVTRHSMAIVTIGGGEVSKLGALQEAISYEREGGLEAVLNALIASIEGNAAQYSSIPGGDAGTRVQDQLKTARRLKLILEYGDTPAEAPAKRQRAKKAAKQ